MAVAMLAIPSIASADVPRCQAEVPVSTTITTATFTAIQPANGYNQWERLWTRNFTVIVNADNTFTGTTEVLGDDANGTFDAQVPHEALVPDETVTGSFNADRTKVTFTATRVGGAVVWGLADAPMNNTSITVATLNVSTPEPVEFKVSAPVFTDAVTTTPGIESVKNHGQFVKAAGGGKAVAQACAGMPLNSTQGTK